MPTAWALLHETARLRPGETVLVHAAAGGVGTVAAQVARHLGAGAVYGTVGSPDKVEYARRSGFDGVFVRDGWQGALREATGGRGVDVVLESVGGETVRQSLDALAPAGKVVIFGNSGNEPLPAFTAGDLWFANRSLLAYSIGHLSRQDPERQRRISLQALGLLARGIVRIDVTDILPLEQAAEAHRRLENRATVGKLLLRVKS